MANLENPAGTGINAAKDAVAGDYLNYNTGARAGAPQVPGVSGPFANFLLPGMGDAKRFGAFPVRDSTGDVENQLGVYDLMGRNITASNPGGVRYHTGPIGNSGVVGELEGYTQRLNLAALVGQAKIHEKMILQSPRFWINAIKSERFAPHAGWEQKIEVFRGGLMPQSGLSRWRKLLPVPQAGFNNPSNYPGFQTYETTTEEYVGTGFETGWGSETIDIDFLRNVPDAAQRVKEYLEFGVTEGLNIREIWNRETYIQLSCAAHKAFVMCPECECVEDMDGARVYLYDPHIATDAVKATTTSVTIGGETFSTDMTGAPVASGSYYALVDDRTVVSADKKLLCKLTNMCDCYGQYHAVAAQVTDPKTGEAGPFIIVDAGPKGKALPVSRPNFDVLERATDILGQICPEQAVTQDSGAPVFGITFKPDDINKLAKANPADWRTYLEARPEALLSYYGLVQGKTFRRWSITNDNNQMRFKPVRYIDEYTAAKAADYGNIGFRPGDDTAIQGRAVYVCVVVNPLMLSKNRRGTNGIAVPVPNPEYARAPLAIANVYLRDTFINQLEGAPEGVGNGTEFGPFPIFNGTWGFLNIRDRKENPFGTKGNFYGIFRNHIMPTKYTREAMSFVYARDTVAFDSYFQAQNKVINPTYTGEMQSVGVTGAPGLTATTVNAGAMLTITLDPTVHPALGVGNIAKLCKSDNTGTDKDVVILDDTMWPKVVVAPTAALTVADVGITVSDGAVTAVATVLKAK